MCRVNGAGESDGLARGHHLGRQSAPSRDFLFLLCLQTCHLFGSDENSISRGAAISTAKEVAGTRRVRDQIHAHAGAPQLPGQREHRSARSLSVEVTDDEIHGPLLRCRCCLVRAQLSYHDIAET